MSNKLLIVDGNNLLFQMFYGIPTKIYNKRGRTIHATIGFVSALQKLVKNYEIDRCVVVFDYDGSGERKELLDTYKANREQNWEELPQDEVPFFEEEYIFDCLRYLGVCLLQSKNMEADDLIASIALKESKENEVYIASFDSDFFQLITENVSVIRYRGEKTKLVTKQSFIDEFTFSPERYAFYKSLTGDTADNIQGVPSIGKKRATEIVKTCADMQALKEDALTFLPCKAKECVFSSFALLERNLALITLQEKQIEDYDAGFDEEKMRLRNSQILSACHVFD
ncbi:MAG: flap endonuclease [Clostridia bacterium]|nr:flap endonuclease [Clostridia bacterium]